MEKKILNALLNSVEKNYSKKLGIAFSGGIDSTLLALACKKLGKDFSLYTVGLQGSHDIDWATKIALTMSWPLKIKLVSENEATGTITTVANMLGTDDPVQVGVGCVTKTVLGFAKENNSKLVFSGLGADEAFAGYGSHKKALENGDVQAECAKRIEGVKKDVDRDEKIAELVEMKIATPFLDEELLDIAMQVDVKDKIDNDQKKIILRRIAVELGLPEELAERPKKAAQYGSGFDKVIEKLAKESGLDKKEYLATLITEVNPL